jgi:hypothetical protein
MKTIEIEITLKGTVAVPDDWALTRIVQDLERFEHPKHDRENTGDRHNDYYENVGLTHINVKLPKEK